MIQNPLTLQLMNLHLQMFLNLLLSQVMILPGSVPAIAPSTAEEPPSTVEAIPFPEAS